MHNLEDKSPARTGFEPGTSRPQAPIDTNELSGTALRYVSYDTALQIQDSKVKPCLFEIIYL